MHKYVTLLRGIVGAIALLASSFFGSLTFLTPALPLAFIPGMHSIFRIYTDFWVSAWLTYAIAIMRMFHRVEIVTHGDHFLNFEKALIVMNHRTRLDWFYFWSPILSDGCLYDLKIALKRTLARIPGAGWAQQISAFLFLNRRADIDVPRITDYLIYLSSFRDRAFKLLVFPEGTDYCDSSKLRSDAFADKSGLPRYEYVLHPRTTGVDLAFNLLKERDSLDAVYDVTIAYDGPFPCSELAVISGDLPQTVRFIVKRYTANEVADVGPTKFWQKIWAEKEDYLKAYYNGEKSKELGPARSEGILASFLEWAALILWTVYLILLFFVILPRFWYLYLVTAIGYFVWSEYTPNSIDGAIIQAGLKK